MATNTRAISAEGRVRSMIKWYDRIGNTIQMNVNGEWINGKIVEGYRTHDGCVNMETDTGRKIGCGASMEGVSFKKCNDSLGDLQTNADRIRSMSDEELAEFLCKVKSDYQWADHEFPSEEECGEWEEWLQSEVEE